MTFESLYFSLGSDLCSVIPCGNRELIEFTGGLSGVKLYAFLCFLDNGIMGYRQ